MWYKLYFQVVALSRFLFLFNESSSYFVILPFSSFIFGVFWVCACLEASHHRCCMYICINIYMYIVYFVWRILCQSETLSQHQLNACVKLYAHCENWMFSSFHIVIVVCKRESESERQNKAEVKLQSKIKLLNATMKRILYVVGVVILWLLAILYSSFRQDDVKQHPFHLQRNSCTQQGFKITILFHSLVYTCANGHQTMKQTSVVYVWVLCMRASAYASANGQHTSNKKERQNQRKKQYASLKLDIFHSIVLLLLEKKIVMRLFRWSYMLRML